MFLLPLRQVFEFGGLYLAQLLLRNTGLKPQPRVSALAYRHMYLKMNGRGERI